MKIKIILTLILLGCVLASLSPAATDKSDDGEWYPFVLAE